MNKKLVVVFLGLILTGCNTIPKDAFKLTESNLESRNLQSRAFDTTNEVELLSAGISVLQDMGYQIDESEKNLGLITASKTADASDAGQMLGAIFLSALSGAYVPIEDNQKITVSFVTIPKSDNKFYARATFQKVVWDTRGLVTQVQTINNSELYEEFFDKLSKSVFLEKVSNG